ncbi:MAG: thiamine diphosphokinase [Paracoccaceae bacterium]
MKIDIIQTSQNVTLVGAGAANKEILTQALRFAPYLIAADGGAELALNCGETPKFVIGDFDSVNGDVLAKIPEHSRIKIPGQDNTDFDKCLRRIHAPLILGVGFLGRRLDHQLAALSELLRHADRAVVLISADDLVFHAPPKLRLSLRADMRLSLLPLRPVTGLSQGLKWPIAGLRFAPGARHGTSNRTLDGAVSLEMHAPGMLVIVPRAALPDVVRALSPR